MEIKDLITRCRAAEEYAKDVLGYDTVEFLNVYIRSTGGVTINITLYDDFQKDLSSDVRYNHEWSRAFSYDSLESIPANPLAHLPSRATRELKVLARQLASIKGMEDKIVDLEARAFVEELRGPMENLHRRLEAPEAFITTLNDNPDQIEF